MEKNSLPSGYKTYGSRDYEIRIWSDKTRWVDISISGELQYSKSNIGEGMQCNADSGTKEYWHIMDLCDDVRSAVLKLNAALMELEERRGQDAEG